MIIYNVDFYAVAGDTGPTLVSTLKDENRNPISFGPWDSVYFTLRGYGGGAVVVNDQPGSLSTGTPGQVSYTWGKTDLLARGTYEARWRVSFSSGTYITHFPNDDEYMIVEVSGSL